MSKSVLAHMRWGKSRMSAILVKSVHSSAAAAGTHVFTVYVHCTVYTHRTHTHTHIFLFAVNRAYGQTI